MKFHAIRLLVSDFQKSLHFYRDVLGFSEWHDDVQEYAYFEEQHLSLFSYNKMSPVIGGKNKPFDALPSSSKAILQFEVKNVDNAFYALKEKGISFINEPHDQKDWGSRVTHFCDPDGNMIELYHSVRS